MRSLFLKYYRDTILYNLVFSIIVGVVGNFFICFVTFGSLVSFIAHQYQKGNEYYFYYNYGYTRLELWIKTNITNIVLKKNYLVFQNAYPRNSKRHDLAR